MIFLVNDYEVENSNFFARYARFP